MSKTPTLIWAQRVEKVFVTWESLATKEVNVTFSEGLLTIEGTLANGDVYKLDCPLPKRSGQHIIYNTWQRGSVKCGRR